LKEKKINKKKIKKEGGGGGGGGKFWYHSNVATACLQQGGEYHNVYGPISSLLSGSWAFCSSYELGGGVSLRPPSLCSTVCPLSFLYNY